jgi:hypothetical protein
MPDRGGDLALTEEDWEFIFKSLELSRSVFANNPVLLDIMPEVSRELYIEKLSGIMDKIGLNGSIAASYSSSSSSSKKSSSSISSSSFSSSALESS